jgi:NDP-sugar pyrophosphorylase family protein
MSGFTQEFQLVFLAGGYGRRLGPLADETAKALLPVCNRPILSYELETMENAGFTRSYVLFLVVTFDWFSSLAKVFCDIF